MWQRLDETKLRNVGGGSPIARRVYGLNGEKFPRLVISISRVDVLLNSTQGRGDGYRTSCSIKSRGGEWWEEGAIPLELFTDLQQMIHEVRKKENPQPDACNCWDSKDGKFHIICEKHQGEVDE